MLFSVIVPIYNIEKYIRRCIDSVLMQSFTDYELILVDDGSPDSCGRICDEYAQRNNKIKVIHKENGGLVSARQAGIMVAEGEYVVNLDGDDAMIDGALDVASRIIYETDADIVALGHRPYTDGVAGEAVLEPYEAGLYVGEEIDNKIFPRLLCNENMEHMLCYIWGKVIRRSIIKDNQLKVSTNISHGEDLSCIVPCYLQAESIYISREPAFYYTMRGDSLSGGFKTKQITQIALTIEGFKKIKGRKPADFDEQIARYSCFMCFAMLALVAEGNNFKALDEIKELIKNSLHMEEIKKAEFENITAKSLIAIDLMKRKQIKSAFYFLYFCKKLKRIRKGW